MPLNRAQKKMLYAEGWLPREIRDLVGAIGGDIPSNSRVKQSFNFNSKVFIAVRKSRRRYMQNLKDQGWSEYERKQKVLDWYKNPTNSVFLFIKLEYRPSKTISDFSASLKLRSRAKISRHFGRAYGRQMRKNTLPKYLPKRPLYPTKPKPKLVRRIRRVRRPQ